RNGASGFNANTFGLMVGMDKDVSDATSLAFAFGWGRSLLDSNNNFNSADINAFQLAASGIYHLDADTFLRFSANGGINQNDGQRTIVFGGLGRIANSSYNSWTAHAGAEAGRSFAVDEKMSLTPSLRVDYAVIRDNSYTETGAGALNLNVGSSSIDELLLGGDVKLGYALSDTAMFTASVGGAYDALQEQAFITSSFAGAPGAAFATAGINPSRWLGRGGAGLNFKASDTMEVVAAYDGEVRKDFFNQTGSIKLVMAF
ncbi:MAG: autotransporter outer membrane beta-barrel domain-containing protein, partial [Mariprofundaceae bacterium]|nr:autotransporter outer membrane beta-barrel domain-containing protein [Mariprofundaceae bacterium]